MAELLARSIAQPRGAFIAQRLFMMTSPFSPTIEIFVVFIFADANLSTKTAKFAPYENFLLYVIVML